MVMQGEPRYEIKSLPREQNEAEVRRRLEIFDRHCEFGWSRGLRRNFDVYWTSERGSVAIEPSSANPNRDYIFSTKSQDDNSVRVFYISGQADMRLSVEGLDFHLFFDKVK